MFSGLASNRAVKEETLLHRAWLLSISATVVSYIQLCALAYLAITGAASMARLEVWFYTSIASGLVALPLGASVFFRGSCEGPAGIGVGAAIFGVMGSFWLGLTSAPAIAAFGPSRAAFEAIADNIQAGRPQKFPKRVGVFNVVDAGPTLGSKGAYIRVSKTYGGGAGFLWSPTLNDEGLGFNLNPGERIGTSKWFYSEED